MAAPMWSPSDFGHARGDEPGSPTWMEHPDVDSDDPITIKVLHSEVVATRSWLNVFRQMAVVRTSHVV